jgi:hypothetical protein
MTTASLMGSVLGDALKAASLTGRGHRWRTHLDELTWIVELDELPHGRRLGIDIGVWFRLLGHAEPARATDCPVLVHVENLLLDVDLDRADIIQSLDLDSSLDEDERAEAIRRLGEGLAQYISNHRSLDAIREAYRRGALRSAFIRKDARGVLESSR